jgi:hypothetical protein
MYVVEVFLVVAHRIYAIWESGTNFYASKVIARVREFDEARR